MVSRITALLQASVAVKQQAAGDTELMARAAAAVDAIVAAFQGGHKVLFCGNGGSAADAQHLAAEFSGRFYKDRTPLPAEALHVNTSYLTAVGNDYGYEHVYSRLLTGIGQRGDVLVSFSTSGNSANIINAMQVAREKGITNIAFTGETGGKMAPLADVLLNVPSTDTPRIQEVHITLGHSICQLVEEAMFPA